MLTELSLVVTVTVVVVLIPFLRPWTMPEMTLVMTALVTRLLRIRTLVPQPCLLTRPLSTSVCILSVDLLMKTVGCRRPLWTWT